MVQCIVGMRSVPLSKNTTVLKVTVLLCLLCAAVYRVLYDISREKICWWIINHFYVMGSEKLPSSAK